MRLTSVVSLLLGFEVATFAYLVGLYHIEPEEPRVQPVQLTLAYDSRLFDGQVVRCFEGVLENHSHQELRIVRPGEGSTDAWRTPAVYWRINGRLQSPGSRGGHFGAIKIADIVAVPPGGKQNLTGWIGFPKLTPGERYSVALVYRNHPGLYAMGKDETPVGTPAFEVVTTSSVVSRRAKRGADGNCS